MSTSGVLSNIHCVGMALAASNEPVGARRAAGTAATPSADAPRRAAPFRKLRRLRSAGRSLAGLASTCQTTKGSTPMAAPT